MATRSELLFLGGGSVVGLMVGLWWSGSPAPSAGAQPPPAVAAPAAGRYQISSFVLLHPEQPGAYILDTQTGEVSQVLGRSEPVRVAGSAAKPLPPK